MIEEGQSVANPDSDFSNRFLDHVVYIYKSGGGRGRGGGDTRNFRGLFREKS